MAPKTCNDFASVEEMERAERMCENVKKICSRSLCKDAKNGCIPEMGHDMLGQKARSKKAQTPELQSTATVEYLYPDNPAVYDSIRFRHSSAIVTMS